VPSKKITDEAIAEAVVAALDRDEQIEVEDVTVAVNNGIVTLTGEVPTWTAKNSAELDVSFTAGVIDVNDELRIAA